MPATGTTDVGLWVRRGCPLTWQVAETMRLQCNDRRAVIRSRCHPTAYWTLMADHFLDLYDGQGLPRPQDPSDDATPIGSGEADDQHAGNVLGNTGPWMTKRGSVVGALKIADGISLWESLFHYQTEAEHTFRNVTDGNMGANHRHELWRVDGMIGFGARAGTDNDTELGDVAGQAVAYADPIQRETLWANHPDYGPEGPFSDVVDFWDDVLESDSTDYQHNTPSTLGPRYHWGRGNPVSAEYLQTMLTMYASLHTAAICTIDALNYSNTMRDDDSSGTLTVGEYYGFSKADAICDFTLSQMTEQCLDDMINRTGALSFCYSEGSLSTDNFWPYEAPEGPDTLVQGNIPVEMASDVFGPTHGMAWKYSWGVKAHPSFVEVKVYVSAVGQGYLQMHMHTERFIPNLTFLLEPPIGSDAGSVTEDVAFIHSRIESDWWHSVWIDISNWPFWTYQNGGEEGGEPPPGNRFPTRLFIAEYRPPVEVKSWTPIAMSAPGSLPDDPNGAYAIGTLWIDREIQLTQFNDEVGLLLKVTPDRWNGSNANGPVVPDPGSGTLPKGNPDGSSPLSLHWSAYPREVYSPGHESLGGLGWFGRMAEVVRRAGRRPS